LDQITTGSKPRQVAQFRRANRLLRDSLQISLRSSSENSWLHTEPLRRKTHGKQFGSLYSFG
jgi:hypothetical protein